MVSTTLCSGAKYTVGPTNSRADPVCSGVVRYGWAPALRCADSLSTFGPSAATTRAAGGHLCGVQHVKVLDQHVVGLAVLVGVLRVADADTEQEPAGIGVLDAVVGLGDLLRQERSRR